MILGRSIDNAGRPHRAWPYALAITVVCVHPLLNLLFRGGAQAITYIAFLSVALAGFWSCWQRASHSKAGLQLNWKLLSVALLFWIAGTLMAAWSDLVQHASTATATIDDFFYFFYGVPILLVIVAPGGGKKQSLFFWLDGIQAAAVGYLAYVVLYSALPFTNAQTQPISLAKLIWIYDIEGFSLAVFAAIRLLVTAKPSAEHRFFGLLTSYLWVYAICASVYNHLFAAYATAGVWDVLPDVPFLLLVLTVSLQRDSVEVLPSNLQRNSLALLIDNARPVGLGLALLTLSLLVARSHLWLAAGTIFGAFVLYGLRSTILQSHLLLAQQQLELARDRLEQLVLLDSLTGVANRRCFDQRLELEWHRAHRAQSALSLLLIDIDRFKELNDTYGHLVGDESLVQVAKTLRRTLNRPSDLFARYGGEEFVVLLPETDAPGARIVAARLQKALANTSPTGGVQRQVTLSIGVTTWKMQAEITTERFLEAADRALYQAKQNGRDRIEYVGLDAPLPEKPRS